MGLGLGLVGIVLEGSSDLVSGLEVWRFRTNSLYVSPEA